MLKNVNQFGTGTAFNLTHVIRLSETEHRNALQFVVLDGSQKGANITRANAVKKAAYADILSIIPERAADVAAQGGNPAQRDDNPGIFAFVECTDGVFQAHIRQVGDEIRLTIMNDTGAAVAFGANNAA